MNFAGPLPDNVKNMLNDDVKRLSRETGLHEDQIYIKISGTGPLAGTWIHRNLSPLLVFYYDRDGTKGMKSRAWEALVATAPCAQPCPPYDIGVSKPTLKYGRCPQYDKLSNLLCAVGTAQEKQSPDIYRRANQCSRASSWRIYQAKQSSRGSSH